MQRSNVRYARGLYTLQMQARLQSIHDSNPVDGPKSTLLTKMGSFMPQASPETSASPSSARAAHFQALVEFRFVTI
eukprot:scaffold163766_cov22-Tisochrysis_lutea.AAC.1